MTQLDFAWICHCDITVDHCDKVGGYDDKVGIVISH